MPASRRHSPILPPPLSPPLTSPLPAPPLVQTDPSLAHAGTSRPPWRRAALPTTQNGTVASPCFPLSATSRLSVFLARRGGLFDAPPPPPPAAALWSGPEWRAVGGRGGECAAASEVETPAGGLVTPALKGRHQHSPSPPPLSTRGPRRPRSRPRPGPSR
ncbi:protein enabled homolog [Portunus trituberculatus]|uniref:protein enabled homolog n=1 Tax=Portunus trituberculatus TaxID=210409 RepID=UPI001E1CDA47|nr:protein enabled homolog [Portunus trituberculatus]